MYVLATLTRKCYRLSVDAVLDLNGRVWQAVDVAKNVNGELELVLDTTPFDDRLYCYHSNQWTCYSRGGAVMEVTDTNILEFLAAVQQALSGPDNVAY